MRYIFFIFSFIFFSFKKVFSSKKYFSYKTFFPRKNIFSANNVYFVKNKYFFKKKNFFFNLVLQQMNNHRNAVQSDESKLRKFFSVRNREMYTLLKVAQYYNYTLCSYRVNLLSSWGIKITKVFLKGLFHPWQNSVEDAAWCHRYDA